MGLGRHLDDVSRSHTHTRTHTHTDTHSQSHTHARTHTHTDTHTPHTRTRTRTHTHRHTHTTHARAHTDTPHTRGKTPQDEGSARRKDLQLTTQYPQQTDIHAPEFTGLAQIIILILTYLVTPWCRVLLEKLTGLQLVKKFPAFHGTRRFITALTSVRHLS